MVQAYGKHVVVKRDPLEMPPDVSDRFGRKTSVILIPEIAKARSRHATVLHVGPEVEEDIRQGDRVVITWLDGTRFTDKDQGEIELLLESEVLAITYKSTQR